MNLITSVSWQLKPRPGNDLRLLLNDFETVGEAKRRADRLCRVLLAGSPAHVDLAERLAACQSGQRCGLVPCPRCRRRSRIWRVGQMLRAFKAFDQVWFVSLIPPDLSYPAGALEGFNPRALTERVKRQLGRAKLDVIVVGSVDFSFEVFEKIERRPRQPSVWQPHLHFVVAGCNKHDLQRSFEGLYPTTINVPRPLLIREVTDPAEAFSYTLKPFWHERVHYRKDGQARLRKVALKPAQQRELALLASEWGDADLQLLRGARWASGRLRLFSTEIGKNA